LKTRRAHQQSCQPALQALRNLTLDGNPVILRREVARLTAEVEVLRGSKNAAALALVSKERDAANEVHI